MGRFTTLLRSMVYPSTPTVRDCTLMNIQSSPTRGAGDQELNTSRRPIRLLLLVTQSQWGGAQRYVHDLAVGLPRDVYDITVAAGSGGPLLKMVHRRGIATWEIPTLVRDVEPIKDLQAMSDLRRGIARHRFDIVHTNSTKAGFIGRIAAWSVGVPAVVYTVHGLVLHECSHSTRASGAWVVYCRFSSCDRAHDAS